MPSPLELIVVAFAVYRLSYMISQEEGPLRLFERFRNLFLNDNWLARGVRCLYCVSFWIGLGAAIFITSNVLSFFLVGFALSGAATVIDRYWKR